MATEGPGKSDHVPMPDFTALKSPLQLGGTGLGQLLQCYQVGTDEIRETLMSECDIIIECKVCRSLYRGLPNFLAHKKSYCSNKFTGSLLRFNDLTTKEDEAFVFGSSTFQDEEDDDDEEVHLGRRPRRRRVGTDTPFSRLHSFFKNLHKTEQNVAKARSTDQILVLNTMDQSNKAVTQSIGSAKKVLESLTGDHTRKRKVEEAQPTGGSPVNPCKVLKVSDENLDVQPHEKGLNGILPNKVGQLTSLKQLFITQKLCTSGSNSCLKCKADFSTNKSLKIHLKRRHMKRRLFNQCRHCFKLYIHNDSFVQHLKDDHGLAKDRVVQQILQPKVEKIILDNSIVFDNFDLKPGGKGKCQVQSISPEAGQKMDDSGNYDNDNIWANDSNEAGQHSENEDEAGSDDPDGSRRGGYLCTKTYWLAMINCLGLYRKGDLKGKAMYYCQGHPDLTFTNYQSYKDHMLHSHIPKVIQCPVCKESFKRPPYKYFVKFMIHLKTVHHITEANIGKLRRGLRKYVLQEPVSDSECDDPEMEDTAEDADSQDDMANHSHEGRMSSREAIDGSSVSQPRRQINRRRAVNLEGGIMSFFNLEDFSCPLCARTYPQLCQVTSHLLSSHGMDKEEADRYKPQIKENRRRQQQQNAENMAAMGRVSRGKKSSGDGERDEDQDPQQLSKRKQASPSKSNSYASNSATITGMVSTPTNITFKSGFSLLRCQKCHRVFGQKSALEIHESSCLKDDGESSMQVSDSVCEEGVDTSSQMIQSPSGSSILKSMLKARFPSLVCGKCNKRFHKKASRASHENHCMGQRSQGAESESSDEDADEKTMDENKNCDKDAGSDSEVLRKVYKCPLCEFEDLELHKISQHLVIQHGWSPAKVAARRDTLKRSIVFKQSFQSPMDSDDGENHPSGRKVTPPRSEVPESTTSGAGASSDTISPMTLEDYQCHLCPRVYWGLSQICIHWSTAHNMTAENIKTLKKEALDRKKKQLAELHVLPRQARRTLLNTGSPKKPETQEQQEPAKHNIPRLKQETLQPKM